MNDLPLTLPKGLLHTTRSVSFPLHMNRDGWLEYGRFLSRAKDGLIFWRASWLDFGRVNFGDDFVRESIAQLEFEFSEVRKSQLLNSLPVRDPDLSAEHHFVLARANSDRDRPGVEAWAEMSPDAKADWDKEWREQWAELAKKESLSANELQDSIKLGRVTRAEKDDSGSSWGGGFATVQGIARQWELLMRQIGDLWLEWTPKETAQFRTEITAIIQFDLKLQSESIRKAGKQE